jgi:hypothetical protein
MVTQARGQAVHIQHRRGDTQTGGFALINHLLSLKAITVGTIRAMPDSHLWRQCAQLGQRQSNHLQNDLLVFSTLLYAAERVDAWPVWILCRNGTESRFNVVQTRLAVRDTAGPATFPTHTARDALSYLGACAGLDLKCCLQSQ